MKRSNFTCPPQHVPHLTTSCLTCVLTPDLQVKRKDDSALQEEEERTVSIIANLLQVGGAGVRLLAGVGGGRVWGRASQLLKSLGNSAGACPCGGE